MIPNATEPSQGFFGLFLFERPYDPFPEIPQFLTLDLLATLDRPVDQQKRLCTFVQNSVVCHTYQAWPTYLGILIFLKGFILFNQSLKLIQHRVESCCFTEQFSELLRCPMDGG